MGNPLDIGCPLCLVYTFLRLAISTSIRHFLLLSKNFVSKDRTKILRILICTYTTFSFSFSLCAFFMPLENINTITLVTWPEPCLPLMVQKSRPLLRKKPTFAALCQRQKMIFVFQKNKSLCSCLTAVYMICFTLGYFGRCSYH